MNTLQKLFNYFTTAEKVIWSGSFAAISISFFVFDGEGYLSYLASVIGITALILCARGNPLGQLMCIVFGLMYAFISFGFAYYGEVITYLGMSVPMAALSLISWLRNPFKGNKSQVAVNRITKREIPFMLVLAVIVTALMYFALELFGTANLIPSTISVFTSFVAVYLTYRRSPYFALAYGINDVVLMVLWILACLVDISYLSVVICFGVFLVNDIYSFVNWRRMQKRQAQG